MQRVDAPSALAWLGEGARRHHGVGLDASGWHGERWILHAMYEHPDLPVDVSYHDVRRRELDAGAAPLTINGVDVEATGVLTGGTLGRSERPGAGWRRLRWSELATRLQLSVPATPPSARSFPYDSWPVSLTPPGEGSLDREQLARLSGLLGDPGQVCHACYPGWITRLDEPGDVVFRLELGELPALYDDPTLPGSPTNLWPRDRSWFVWSDWDLWGTRVSGDAALLAALDADPELETVAR